MDSQGTLSSPNKTRSIHTMEYRSALKRKETLTQATLWKDLEDIVLHKMSRAGVSRLQLAPACPPPGAWPGQGLLFPWVSVAGPVPMPGSALDTGPGHRAGAHVPFMGTEQHVCRPACVWGLPGVGTPTPSFCKNVLACNGDRGVCRWGHVEMVVGQAGMDSVASWWALVPPLSSALGQRPWLGAGRAPQGRGHDHLSPPLCPAPEQCPPCGHLTWIH